MEAIAWLISSGEGLTSKRYITTQEGCSTAITAAFLHRRVSFEEAL
jgi:hypothetical protein